MSSASVSRSVVPLQKLIAELSLPQTEMPVEHASVSLYPSNTKRPPIATVHARVRVRQRVHHARPFALATQRPRPSDMAECHLHPIVNGCDLLVPIVTLGARCRLLSLGFY